jgi:hypothetical protein
MDSEELLLIFVRKIVHHITMATVTKTLKLPFLRLNRVKAEELARLQSRNTEVANTILAMPKPERRKLTSASSLAGRLPRSRSAAHGSTRPSAKP